MLKMIASGCLSEAQVSPTGEESWSGDSPIFGASEAGARNQLYSGDSPIFGASEAGARNQLYSGGSPSAFYSLYHAGLKALRSVQLASQDISLERENFAKYFVENWSLGGKAEREELLSELENYLRVLKDFSDDPEPRSILTAEKIRAHKPSKLSFPPPPRERSPVRLSFFTWNTESVHLAPGFEEKMEDQPSFLLGLGSKFPRAYPDFLPELGNRTGLAVTKSDRGAEREKSHSSDRGAERENEISPEVVVFALQEDTASNEAFWAFLQDYYPRYTLHRASELMAWGISSRRTWERRGLRLGVFVRKGEEDRIKVTFEQPPLVCGRSKGAVFAYLRLLGPRGWRTVVLGNAHFPYYPQIPRAQCLEAQNSFLREAEKTCRSAPRFGGLIFGGDLNYRVARCWGESAAGLSGSLEEAWRRDELTAEMAKGFVPELAEGVGGAGPSFPPTCKVKKDLFPIDDAYYREAAEGPEGPSLLNAREYKFGKKDRRTASWCDRILYTPGGGDSTLIRCAEYEVFDYGRTMMRSDHQGVLGTFEIYP